MIPTNPKIGDVFEDLNTHYEVVSINEDGTFNSRVIIGYVAQTVINDEVIKEMKEVVEKKKTATKTATKKPTTKKK